MQVPWETTISREAAASAFLGAYSDRCAATAFGVVYLWAHAHLGHGTELAGFWKGEPPLGPLTLKKKSAIPYTQIERGRSICLTGKGPVPIPKVKRAGLYPQPERNRSISSTGKGPVHIPTEKGPILFAKLKRAGPYPKQKRGHSIPWYTLENPISFYPRTSSLDVLAETRSILGHVGAIMPATTAAIQQRRPIYKHRHFHPNHG